jgi:hypothetical protein
MLATQMEAHPGLAPGNSVLQTDGSTTLPYAPQKNWGDQRESHPHGGFHRAECSCYNMISIWILRSALPRHDLLYKRSAFLSLPRRNQTGAPARTCTSNSRLRKAVCTALTLQEQENGAPCRCRPGAVCLEGRSASCYTNDAEKWLPPVSRRPLLVFSEALIYLS